jgi:hypothetical protein
MKCDIDNCIHKARWLVDDHGVDTYLCANHYDEFREAEKRMGLQLESLNKRDDGGRAP